MAKKDPETQIVTPTDAPKTESIKFRSASSWTYKNLKVLGVTLDVKKHWNYERVLGVRKYTNQQRARSFL
jgi:hypothetical protein